MRIGCHMSISKGFAPMIQEAFMLGADIVQYFPKNPRSYRLKVFKADELRAAYEEILDLGIDTVAHSPYVTNLATGHTELRQTSITSILNDLEIADAYGSAALVVHCGKHVGQGEERGMVLMAEAVDEIMTLYSGPVRLLLENTAGQGSELGRTVDELLALREQLDRPERVGFCFDTCHAFASGLLDFDRWDEMVSELGRKEFAAHVHLLHLNDSLTPFGARKDRHALLGEGEIGAGNLGRLLREDLFPEVPVVIETPVKDERDYKFEIAKAKSWLAI